MHFVRTCELLDGTCHAQGGTLAEVEVSARGGGFWTQLDPFQHEAAISHASSWPTRTLDYHFTYHY